VAEIEDRLAAYFAAEYRRSPAPAAAARARLVGRLASVPPPRRRARAFAWLLGPRVVLSPLAGACAALALVAIGVAVSPTLRDTLRVALPRPASTPAAGGTRVPAGGAGSERLVQFVLVAPGASRVGVVGDFNGWDPLGSPMRRIGDAWTVAVPVSRGRHVYAFVVDGTRWVSDPAAPLAPEDEFGFRKSVMVVAGADST